MPFITPSPEPETPINEPGYWESSHQEPERSNLNENRHTPAPILPISTPTPILPTPTLIPKTAPRENYAQPFRLQSYNGLTLEKSPYIQLLTGYEDGTLRLHNYISRAETAVVIYRLVVNPVDFLATTNNFNDVTPESWYNVAVSTLYHQGIISGWEGKFHPDEKLTWAELLTIFCMFIDLDDTVTLNNIDAAGHWSSIFVQTAVGQGWIEDCITFQPREHASRGDVVSFIHTIFGQ
jgi:hypothetical protein